MPMTRETWSISSSGIPMSVSCFTSFAASTSRSVNDLLVVLGLGHAERPPVLAEELDVDTRLLGDLRRGSGAARRPRAPARAATGRAVPPERPREARSRLEPGLVELVEELAAALASLAFGAFEEAFGFPVDRSSSAHSVRSQVRSPRMPASRLHFAGWTDDATSELPLFELPVVLLPGELMPLHIFEERYKRMIGHCLEAEEPFGVVLRDDDGSARRIGCTAARDRGPRALRGRAHGHRRHRRASRFRVLERFDGAEYPAGEVEAVPGPTTRPGRPRGRRRRPRDIRRPGAPRVGLRAGDRRASTTATPTRSPPASSCRS